MATKTYNVAAAAKTVNVSASTIRGWCVSFADYLSDATRPESGKERRFTDLDVSTLQRIKELRDEGKSVADIGATLAAEPVTELQPYLDVTVTPLQVVTEPSEPSEPLQLPEVLSSTLGSINERLGRLEATAEADKAYRANYTVVFLAGVIAGLLFLVLLLAVWIALR